MISSGLPPLPPLPRGVKAAVGGSIGSCGVSVVLIALVAIPIILKMRQIIGVGTIPYFATGGALSFVAFCVSYYMLTRAQERRLDTMMPRPEVRREDVVIDPPPPPLVPRASRPEVVLFPPPAPPADVTQAPRAESVVIIVEEDSEPDSEEDLLVVIVDDELPVPPAIPEPEPEPVVASDLPLHEPLLEASVKGKEAAKAESSIDIPGPPPVDILSPTMQATQELCIALLASHHRFKRTGQPAQAADIATINQSFAALHQVFSTLSDETHSRLGFCTIALGHAKTTLLTLDQVMHEDPHMHEDPLFAFLCLLQAEIASNEGLGAELKLAATQIVTLALSQDRENLMPLFRVLIEKWGVLKQKKQAFEKATLGKIDAQKELMHAEVEQKNAFITLMDQMFIQAASEDHGEELPLVRRISPHISPQFSQTLALRIPSLLADIRSTCQGLNPPSDWSFDGLKATATAKAARYGISCILTEEGITGLLMRQISSLPLPDQEKQQVQDALARLISVMIQPISAAIAGENRYHLLERTQAWTNEKLAGLVHPSNHIAKNLEQILNKLTLLTAAFS